jgi:hypothetical protein
MTTTSVSATFRSCRAAGEWKRWSRPSTARSSWRVIPSIGAPPWRFARGSNFTAADIKNATDHNIVVSLYGNDTLIGGMTYYLDPNLTTPSGGKQPTGGTCQAAAQDLLHCLDFCGDQQVKDVRVKKISHDIMLDQGDCD